MKKWVIVATLRDKVSRKFIANDGHLLLRGRMIPGKTLVLENVTEEQIAKMRELVAGDPDARPDGSIRQIVSVYLRTTSSLAQGREVDVSEPLEIIEIGAVPSAEEGKN